MQLLLRDPISTDRLASFLQSLGLRPVRTGPLSLELERAEEGGADRAELEIYLRVWRVLYPEGEVELVESATTS
jgi:hypothetical protein